MTRKPSVETFCERHIGSSEKETDEMLSVIGVNSLEMLVKEIVPERIRLKSPLRLADALTESEMAREFHVLASKNKGFKSYLGLGYYGCHTPGVIQRNIFENPGWYTAYTPYQAEIAQGRLEALFNFQTMVCELTQMSVANASLLDEGTAAAEAMLMLYRLRTDKQVSLGVNEFFVSETCFPQTVAVLQGRANALGITLHIGDHLHFQPTPKTFGVLLQYPSHDGLLLDYRSCVERLKQSEITVAVAADLLSLTLLIPPGEWGADVVIGNTQRFGIPIGYGGPHAAYFATREEFKRQIPGRIIGLSIDRHGNPAYRMALQTREQHIRKEKATSNICTAQALLATMAGMFAVYMGPKRLKASAEQIHHLTVILYQKLIRLGYTIRHASFFDTLRIDLNGTISSKQIQTLAESQQINLRYFDSQSIGISCDETTTPNDVEAIVSVFQTVANGQTQKDLSLRTVPPLFNKEEVNSNLLTWFIPKALRRTSAFLTQEVFNAYHTETKMTRYLKSLENKDLSLNTSMIPLGSCTMKLNSVTELTPLSWPKFSTPHPFVPENQVEGYHVLIKNLENWLCEITGMDAISFQPNSGAQGEYAGLLIIRAYHEKKGQKNRNVILIPSSAHGTNFASVAMAGMEVVVVKCDEQGNVDIDDLKVKAKQTKDTLAALMITYPSTHGVFEDTIHELCSLIHSYGGQIYMDGANMNAQVGLTSPGIIGADVCHLNLHKTFAIPHGGGGPGMGPVCVKSHLQPFLPQHPLTPQRKEGTVYPVSSAPWGSASLLLISYAYIRMLGSEGLTKATKTALLNANYMKARLEPHYPILFTGHTNRVAHELIIDVRPFKKEAEIDVEDIAKRLMDYGFHAPTISWPVPGTMMIEPTESEDRDEIDRFCDALLSIRKEIQDIVNGKADKCENVLKNAPHTVEEVSSDSWEHSYSRSQAAFPLPYLKTKKFWPSVGRINQAYGDRNLVCSCQSISADPVKV